MGGAPCLIDGVVLSAPEVDVSFLNVNGVSVPDVDVPCLLDCRDPSFEGADFDFERTDPLFSGFLPLFSGFLPLFECDNPSLDIGFPRIA